VSSTLAGLENISLWSDGPYNQFKNRKMLEFYRNCPANFGKRITVNFFGPHHGKSDCDRHIGAARNKVWRAVLDGEQRLLAGLSPTDLPDC